MIRLAVRAWLLQEGDRLSDGAEIISVHRNPATYDVAVLTNKGERLTLPGDHLVPVVTLLRGFRFSRAPRRRWFPPR